MSNADNATWVPKAYHTTGRKLEWGQNIPPDKMAALRTGEVFILCTAAGDPYSEVLMDSYGTIREQRINAGAVT